jgi:hypothetical protein
MTFPRPRCRFSFSDGRYGRMPRAVDHPEYRIQHSREDRQLLETERIGELSPPLLPANSSPPTT